MPTAGSSCWTKVATVLPQSKRHTDEAGLPGEYPGAAQGSSKKVAERLPEGLLHHKSQLYGKINATTASIFPHLLLL